VSALERRNGSRSGVTTIGALAALSDLDLRALLPGQVGQQLRNRARVDPRRLETTTERISISVEETFERDLLDREVLHAELRRMADDLGTHLRRNGQSARTVTASCGTPTSRSGAARRAWTSGSTTPNGSGSSRARCSIVACETGRERCASSGCRPLGLSDFRQLSLDERTRNLQRPTLKTGSICR
jgi:nucleotidyltransferase/DNA polymerase involved in DNA repair